AEVSDEATETARRVLLLRERNRSDITAHLGRGAAQGHRILESLYDRPILSVADAQTLTGTSYAPTNQIIARMTELGILKEITGNARNRRFAYEPYVRLFTDDPEDEQ